MAKQVEIECHLRRRILDGALLPGALLPSRLRLRDEIGGSPVTIQRAVDRLKRQGFLRTRNRSGTFVAEHLPHLCRFGLVFPHRPVDDQPWSLFWDALIAAAAGIEKSSPRQLPAFYHSTRPGDPAGDCQHLLDAVLHNGVAGLIFAAHPYPFIGTPVLDRPGLPRVTITPGEAFPGIPGVYVDTASFYERALDHFRQCGRRRIALVSTGFNTGVLDGFARGLKKRGMSSEACWVQTASLHDYSTAERLVHLLFWKNAGERPDGLIIADDNIVEFATHGLVAAGVAVPRDVTVVAHANYPKPPPAAVPVTRLGFDARRIVETCIARLEQVRRHARVPSVSLVAAQFVEEVKQALEA